MTSSDRDPECELSIVMPCLDEAETLAVCIEKAQATLQREGIDGEVVIADNGSTDGSQDIATAHGARVVPVAARGYGAALMGGIRAARGRYVIMGDADDSYDFGNLAPFVARLREGFGLVMGNRFAGGVQPGAMPPLHRYLGNPVLTAIGRVLFRSTCRDFHCGLRGFDRAAILALDLRTTGMEFASEMVVKATLHELRITEVPTTLSPDGRSRPPHLRSWRDGWRHLRFLLMYSPRWLFLLPGLASFALGAFFLVMGSFGRWSIGAVTFDLHTLVAAAGMVLIGVQMITFAVLAKQYAVRQGLLPEDPRIDKVLAICNLERLVAAGALVFVLGLLGIVGAVIHWGSRGFGEIDNVPVTMRIVVPSVTAMATGVQLVISGFMSSVLELETTR